MASLNVLMKRPWVHGFISMGVFFAWILYLPFYGPGLREIAFLGGPLSHIFLFAHIAGFLHSGWIYSRGNWQESTVGWLEKICLATVFLLTVLFAFVGQKSEPFFLFVVFALLGYASGWLIIRWTAWFSSPQTVPCRGAVWGAALALMNIILFFLTILSHAGNTVFGLLISAVLALIGGYGILRLPFKMNRGVPSGLSFVLPPRLLLIFGVFIFFLSGYPYRQIFPVHVQFPVYLSWMVLIPYLLVGFFLGRWSDQNSHHYLAIVSLLMLGIAFALGTLLPYFPGLILVVEIFVLSGNVCGNLYYWIALADHESVQTSPLSMSIGLSAELFIFVATFMAVPYIPKTIAGSQTFMGAISVLLVLMGIAIFAFSNYGFFLSDKTTRGESKEERVPVLPDVLLPAAVTKERMEETLVKQYNLTVREFEVVYLLMMGYSNDRIGQMLYVSTSTVKFHIGNILRKMDGKNRHDIRKKVHDSCLS